MDVEELRLKLREHGQEHLLTFWDKLTEEQKQTLYDELNDLDLVYVTQGFERCIGGVNAAGGDGKLDDKMQPLPKSICGSVLNLSQKERSEYEELAFKEIAAGKMAILLLAGGQGTRLGVKHPKGMYDVGLMSGKSLFQLQAERIVKLQKLAGGGKVVLYVMASASTVKPTTDFFWKNDFFGLEPENVVVFQQGTLPCFTFDGKIILGSKHELSRAPDGNGGLYRALREGGVLEDMERRGIEYVQLYCVDNVLVRVGDPMFTGYCISKGAECGNKVVPKTSPAESVGITCMVDGKYKVVEYSEITEKAAEMRNEDGRLTYSAGNICIHFFTRKFLAKVVREHEHQLIHHVAKKKIPFVDLETGLSRVPEKPNGIKMEKFVFDVFEFAREDKFAVWECLREQEFAPLKNAPGASDCTPDHCKNALYALHQQFVRAAGGILIDEEGRELPKTKSPAASREAGVGKLDDHNNNPSPNEKHVAGVEISPLVSYAGEGLETLVRGRRVQVPTSCIGLDQN